VLFNYSCSEAAAIYPHPDPCVAASYCLGNASKYYEQDLLELDAKSPDELKAICELNEPMSGGVELQKCSLIMEFCQDEATRATLLGQYAAVPVALEQDLHMKCTKISGTGGCGLKFSVCLTDLMAAFRGKTKLDVPGGMIEEQAEFCQAVAAHNMTATLTALAQCSTDALTSDACAGASAEEKKGLGMFSEIHALCLEECEGMAVKMSQMGECLPEVIRNADNGDHGDTEEEDGEDDVEGKVALCDIIARNKTIVACLEKVTNCCPLTTITIQEGFQQQVGRLGLENGACTEAMTTVDGICVGGKNQEDAKEEGGSGAAKTTATLLASLLAVSHAVLWPHPAMY
jgi:hypothetical protein